MQFSGRQYGGGAAALVMLMAVIVVVGGAFGLIKFLGQYSSTVQLITTKDRLTDGRKALLQFVQHNNRLPCPANPRLLNPPQSAADAMYGLEDTTANCSQTLTFPFGSLTNAIGAIPWKTLGLPLEAALDGYGRLIRYQVVIAATSRLPADVSAIGDRGIALNNPCTITSIPCNISVYLYTAPGQTPAPGLPKSSTNQNELYACNQTPNDNSCNARAVAVLLSHGRDGAGAYLPSGAQLPAPNPALYPEQALNASLSSQLITFNNASLDYFDDVLVNISGADATKYARVDYPTDNLASAITAERLKSLSAIVLDYLSRYQSQIQDGASNCASGSSPGCLVLLMPDSSSTPNGISDISAWNSTSPSPGPTVNFSGSPTPTANNTPPWTDMAYGGFPYIDYRLPIGSPLLMDGWNQAFRYYANPNMAYTASPSVPASRGLSTAINRPRNSTTGPNVNAFQIVSKGADGQFGTPDDMSVTVSVTNARNIVCSVGNCP